MMTGLTDILITDGIVYEPGDILVGAINRDTLKIFSSSEVIDHGDLRRKYGIQDLDRDCSWRYNKITKELFFWTDVTIDVRNEVIDYVKKKGFEISAVKNIYSYQLDSLESKRAIYHSHGGRAAERHHFYNPDEVAIAEAPVDTFQTVGNFDKGASFRDKRDRQLITNPITLTKVKDFFKNTSSDFDFYFVNLKGRRSFAERGDVSNDFIFKSYPDGLGLTPDQLRNGRINSDNITVFFVGNSAAEKIPMTAWTIAHRFGHSIRKDYAFTVLTDWLETEFESLLREYNLEKGKRSYGMVDSGAVRNYDKIKANLFNQVGTMRSARQSEINRPFEFYYELFAQYLKDGKVSLNKLTPSILKKYGSYGREEKMTTGNIDVVTDILHGIERDFPYYAEDVLNSCVGKIYVM